MFRKKSLDSSLTGLTVGAGAIGGPAVEYLKDEELAEVSGVMVCGCAGCLAMNEGMSRARRTRTSGRTERRYGSRHMKEYMARKERVCIGVFQESRRTTLAWKTNTTPIRELNRRKFADIVGREKEGLTVKSGVPRSAS